MHFLYYIVLYCIFVHSALSCPYRILLCFLHYIGLYRTGQLMQFLYYSVLYSISVNYAVYCSIPHSSIRSVLYQSISRRTTYAFLNYISLYRTGQLTHFLHYIVHTAFFLRSALYWPIPHRATYAISALYCPIPHVCAFCIILSYIAFFHTFCIMLAYTAQDNLSTFCILLSYTAFFCTFCVMLANTAHFITFYISLCLHVARDDLFTFRIMLAMYISVQPVLHKTAATCHSRQLGLSHSPNTTSPTFILATMLLSVFISVAICKSLCPHIVPARQISTAAGNVRGQQQCGVASQHVIISD